MVNNLPSYILLLILLFSTVSSTCASSTPLNQKIIPVKSYKKQTGLLSNTVKDVVQDEKGFLWIATDKGLTRFDSKNFKHFVPDKSNNNSIPSNDIDFMMNLPKHKLWLSVLDVGISSINKTTFVFNSIKNKNSPLFNLPNKNLFGMAHDQEGNIWLSLFGTGIYQWNIQQQTLIKHIPENKKSWLKSKKTFEIFIDSKNILWVCTIDSKVYRYNINTGESKEFLFTEKNQDPMSNPIYSFTESQNGEIFAGGYSGVYKFNAIKQSFEPFISKEQIAKFYNGNRVSVRRLTIDSKENIWIGTTKSLLLFSNNSLSKVSFLENGEFIKGDWTIYSIIEDLDGNIWIATDGVGLIKIPYDWERFIVSSGQDTKSNSFTDATLFQNNLWVNYPSSTLDLFTIKNGSLIFKKELYLNLGEKDVNIDRVLQYNNNYLWVASLKGIHRINLITEEVSKIKLGKSQELNSVTQLIHSKNKLLYFSTFDGEIGYIDNANLTAHIINQELLTGNKLTKIIDGFDQNIWFLTSNKIVSLNTEHNTLKTIYRIPKEQSISDIFIEQEKDKIWVIKNGGLFLLKWNGDTLIEQDNYFANILPTVVFTQIVKIQGDTFLINTIDSGFIELNIETLEYQVFTTENGLPSNSIKKIIKNKGSLIIVTEVGIAIQNPDFNEQPPLIPHIVIDEVSLGNIPFSENEKVSLTLNYNYGAINFDVALLSYTDSSTFEYQYKLKGATEDWISTGNNNRFAFLNLKGGRYNFQVKGRSNYGKWSDIAEFPFRVKAAPWKTLWAYALYFISAILLLSWLLYLYKRKILYEHEISKKQAQKELADAASKAKSDFLARVSHEVRTPLNGVLGMSELLLDTQVDEEQKIYADTIQASGKHLLDIINDILDLSKIEAGKLELEELPFDLLLLVDEVCTSFISQCRQKQLMFSCVFNHKTPRHRIGDVIRIKQILFNLLSNAFKFTKEGEIYIKINYEENSDDVIISVHDTGIGIDDELIQSLFEPFVQADSAITRRFGGTGLGLAICKQLTEKMHGTINASSRPNIGTTFTIRLPLKRVEVTVAKATNKPCQTDSHVCLLLEDSHLQQSIIEYCQLLHLSYSHQVKQSTTCVFISQDFIANGEFNAELNKAKMQNTKIVTIDFDEHSYPQNMKALNIPLIFSPPPLTFKKIQELCLENFDNRQSQLNAVKIIKHQRALKLLVVEDSAINQQVSIEMLEKMGHMVDVVDNAEEGLTMLQRNNYDMLFLDYHLPGMDGFQLIEQWENSRKIPVIMVTADLTDDVLIKAQKYHMTEVVAKPFSQQTLSNIIQKTMEFD